MCLILAVQLEVYLRGILKIHGADVQFTLVKYFS